ncbi:unnamed protein product [Spodoptera exigua]|nr:unnamed protein product [Spodoptera exigua]
MIVVIYLAGEGKDIGAAQDTVAHRKLGSGSGYPYSADPLLRRSEIISDSDFLRLECRLLRRLGREEEDSSLTRSASFFAMLYNCFTERGVGFAVPYAHYTTVPITFFKTRLCSAQAEQAATEINIAISFFEKISD